MRKPGEAFDKIDYRDAASRKSDRARTTKANLLFAGALAAIAIGAACMFVWT